MSEADSLLCVGMIVFVAIMTLGIREALRRERVFRARVEAIRAAEGLIIVLDDWNCRVQAGTINGATERRQRGVIGITERELIVYDRTLAVKERGRFRWEDIQWFGRPEKYITGNNDIWLHFQEGEVWRLVKIRLYLTAMQDLVRTVKPLVRPELVTAYRRRRPYIHVGPLEARPATQDIHGAWSVGQPIDLYLMPRFLVFFEGERAPRKIALESVQRIGALRRIDQPGADGLVRFDAEEESFAFAMRGYESFAGQLAEAAKRTLEAPLERKQKGKDYEDDWDE